jgi:hypothetical protein
MRGARKTSPPTAGAPSRDRGGPRADRFLIVALALATRVPRLGESLWYDEVFYSTHERFTTWQELLDSFLRSIAAPLYRLLLFAWVELVGDHEVVVRLPSLAFGVGSIVLTYELARRWIDLPTARLAAAWLCLAPAHVWYSQEATPYALVALLVLAAVCLAERCADRSPTWGAAALAAAAFVAAFFTHYLAIVAIVPLALLALAAPPPARRRLLAACALAGFAAVALAMAKRSSGNWRTGQVFLREFDALEAWMFLGQWCAHGNTLWPMNPYRASLAELAARPGLVAVQLAAAVVLALGIRRALAGGARQRLLVGCLVALPGALWALSLAGYRHLYVERYAFWALPFYALLAAWGARSFSRPLARQVVAALWLALAAAAYAGWYVENDRWTVYKQNSDWRAAAADLAARSSPADRALVISVSRSLALRYHLRRIGAFDSLGVTDGDLRRVPRALRRGVRRFFVVEDLYWKGDLARVLAALDREPRLRRVAVHSHRGVRLFEFEARGEGDAGGVGAGAPGSSEPPAGPLRRRSAEPHPQPGASRATSAGE